jgi:hypothetical protein
MAENPFDELAGTILKLEDRVAELEKWRAVHIAGMTRRQQQIDQVQRVAQRDRFLSTLRRGRR